MKKKQLLSMLLAGILAVTAPVSGVAAADFMDESSVKVSEANGEAAAAEIAKNQDLTDGMLIGSLPEEDDMTSAETLPAANDKKFNECLPDESNNTSPDALPDVSDNTSSNALPREHSNTSANTLPGEADNTSSNELPGEDDTPLNELFPEDLFTSPDELSQAELSSGGDVVFDSGSEEFSDVPSCVYQDGIWYDYIKETDSYYVFEIDYGNGETLHIPSELYGKKVTELGPNLYVELEHMDSLSGDLIMPNTIQKIGERAFWYCDAVRLYIPDSVTEMGKEVFYECQNLKWVHFPAGMKIFRWDLFKDCKALRTIEIGEGLTEITSGAMTGCPALEKLIIPESVTAIGEHPFADGVKPVICGVPGSYAETYAKEHGLPFTADADTAPVPNQKVVIQDGIRYTYYKSSDSYYVTDYTEDLKEEVIIPEKVNNKKVTAVRKDAFMNCPRLKSIQLPKTITAIGSRAFYQCINLESIKMQKGLRSVGAFAFAYDRKLNKLLLPDTVTALGEGCMYSCHLEQIPLPPKLKKIPDKLFCNAYIPDNPQLPSDIKSIGTAAFAGTPITRIRIPDTVVSIDARAFQECRHLRSVELSASAASIGAYAFEYCEELEMLKIPNSVRTIGSRAFASTGLLRINLPSVVNSISKDAFADVPKITLYVKPNTYAEQFAKKYGISYDYGSMKKAFITQNGITYQSADNGYKVFRAKETIEGAVTIPKKISGRNITAIEKGAFAHCRKITSVKLPDTVQTIGESAFLDSGVRTVNLPDGIKILEPTLFMQSALEEITIPQSVTAIGNSTFRDTKLKKIILPDTVKSIGERVFTDCADLKEIRFPQGIKNIPVLLCAGCSSLEVIDLPSSVGTIGESAFASCFEVKEMHLPERLFSIGERGLEYPETCTIYGKTNSLAETIAKEHNYTFISEGESILDAPEVDARVTLGNCVRVYLRYRAPSADGCDMVISKDKNFPETNDYLYWDSVSVFDKTTFYCLEKGTYYIFARSGTSYVSCDDLEWTFGSWSKPVKITIAYDLPQKPVIKKITQNGQDVTITLEKAENAKWYDFILSRGIYDVFYEDHFFPSYIAYSAKNKSQVTYTFKDVTPGTYYVMARGVSTQKDGKKLYGKWSYKRDVWIE